MGSSAVHYQQVGEMVKAHETSASHGVAGELPFGQPTPDLQLSQGGRSEARQEPAMFTAHASSPGSVVNQPQPLAQPQQLTKRDNVLIELLHEIRKEQQSIRSQISETNREMDELTFRVDSHSTQFRPLRTEGRPRAQVVPDDDYVQPMAGGMQLLPPK